MKKNSILMLVMTLIMALGMSQSVMAKKIEYLGHYYNGKVNKQKIPEGEGGIAIGNVAVFGTFNANNITNAKIEEDWIKISGAISFDESDRITVKAGSNISSTVYLSSTIKYIRNEDDLKKNLGVVSHVFQKTLEKDSIVDLASTHADFNVSSKVYELVPNSPTIISQVHAELVPIEISYDILDFSGRRTGQTAKRQTKIYKIEKSINEAEYRLDNYKDEFGRIWNVSGPTRYKKCVGKVTYPNGSYIQMNEDALEDWEVKYPQGFSIITKRSANGCDYCIIFPDGVELAIPGGNGYEFKVLIDKKKLEKGTISRIRIPVSMISNLSNDEISKIIKEKLSAVIPDYDFNTNDLFPDAPFTFYGIEDKDKALDVYEIGGSDQSSENGGYFYDGHYVSRKSLYAKRNAANKADLNKSIARFKNKYGFDPSVNNIKYIVKVGRNLLGILDARNEWVDEYADNRNNKVTVKLVRDQGASKCYEFYWFNTAYFCGHFWVRNNVITSITWE